MTFLRTVLDLLFCRSEFEVSSLYRLPWWLRQWSVCLQCRRPGFNPWVGKIPWRRKWQSTPVLLPGKSYGQRSLVGCSPWGCKESDTIEQLHFKLFLAKILHRWSCIVTFPLHIMSVYSIIGGAKFDHLIKESTRFFHWKAPSLCN